LEFGKKLPSQIIISDTAIAEIVSHVTSECYGVVGLVNPSIKDGIIKLLHKDHQRKGVIVERDEGKINIKIYVIAQYGTNLKEVAKSLRDTVRFNLEKLTSLSIGKIDVYIQKVNIQLI
jgi:uncharacterized alkaline shock family protein YloU